MEIAGKPDPIYIEVLMDRISYLNEARINVTKFFFAIVTAMGAVVILGESAEKSIIIRQLENGIFILFALGLLVLTFDMFLRARTSRVAQAIRTIVYAPRKFKMRDRIPLWMLLDEDLIFTVIIMMINAVLVMPMFHVLEQKGVAVSRATSPVTLVVAFLVFVLQLVVYMELWLRLARKKDEWPDDSLLVPVTEPSNQDKALKDVDTTNP